MAGAGDPNANYEMMARLDDERRRFASKRSYATKTNHFRAEEYRMQFESERANNERLQDENLRLRREFEIYDRDMKDKERRYINRDRVRDENMFTS